MARILIRSGRHPFTPVGPEATLTQDVFNTNVGNYLFAHSIHRTLLTPGTEIVPDSNTCEIRRATREAAARVNEEFDLFVVPLANAFRPGFSRLLANLTSLIEQLTIPVVVIGVGAQADTSLNLDSLENVRAVSKAFVSSVLDRSATVGVRGQFTADFLKDLGFPASAIDIIGCPSLYLNGPDFRLTAPEPGLSSGARLALNVTNGVPGFPELVDHLTTTWPTMLYVAQDRDDLRLMLWGQEPEPARDTRLPFHLGHRLYREDRVRMPLDVPTWVDMLRGLDFVVGTRLHGNVAALLADTPSLLLAHDSRTVELAEFHGLPHVPMAQVAPDATARSLFEMYDPSPFNAAYSAGFANYLTFLERNGLDHVHAPGRANREFDDGLAAVSFPPPVTPLNSATTDQVAARLRWLRDGQPFDSSSHPQAYHQPFLLNPPKGPPNPQQQAHRATTKKLARLEQQLDRSRHRVKRQRARIDRQGRRLEQQRSRLDRLDARLRELERGGALRKLRRRLSKSD